MYFAIFFLLSSSAAPFGIFVDFFFYLSASAMVSRNEVQFICILVPYFIGIEIYNQPIDSLHPEVRSAFV